MTRNSLASVPYYSSPVINVCFEINVYVLESCVSETHIQLLSFQNSISGIPTGLVTGILVCRISLRTQGYLRYMFWSSFTLNIITFDTKVISF